MELVSHNTLLYVVYDTQCMRFIRRKTIQRLRNDKIYKIKSVHCFQVCISMGDTHVNVDTVSIIIS